MTALTPPPIALPRRGFCLEGRCLGLVRSTKGKVKGLRIETATGEQYLTVDKYVGYAVHCEVERGTPVRVWARQKDDELQAVMVIPLAPKPALEPQLTTPEPPTQPYTIQVCRKGSCHKRGSAQVWQALQETLAAFPDAPVTLEATGCQKACKQGPALRVLPHDRQHTRVSPEAAMAIAQQFAQGQPANRQPSLQHSS